MGSLVTTGTKAEGGEDGGQYFLADLLGNCHSVLRIDLISRSHARISSTLTGNSIAPVFWNPMEIWVV